MSGGSPTMGFDRLLSPPDVEVFRSLSERIRFSTEKGLIR